jgi:hypothetical protein
LVFDDEVLAFGYLISASRVLTGHDIARLGIDVLLLQSVAGLSVDSVETDLFAERRRWIESDRARD